LLRSPQIRGNRTEKYHQKRKMEREMDKEMRFNLNPKHKEDGLLPR
jgi:hypothetical protein